LDAASDASVPKACDEIRRHLGLVQEPPFDVFRALYEHDYHVVFTALSSISGALVRGPNDSGRCAIVVNSDQPDDRQRWTAAHELAHIACGHTAQEAQHIDLYGPACSRIDQEADIVAAEILMPMSRLWVQIRDLPELTPETTYRMANQFHVSYAAFAVRLGTLNLISPQQVTELRKAKPSKLEANLRLKEQRSMPFDAKAVVPGVVQQLKGGGGLPTDWDKDFSVNGPLHLRLIQGEAARHYITNTEVKDRRTSVTEVFEHVAGWVALTYPWAR